MNSLDLLRQAQRADRLGKYKLADRYYYNAIRLAKLSPIEKALEEAAAKSLDRTVIESILRDTALSAEEMAAKLIERGLSDEVALGIKALTSTERIAILDALPKIEPKPIDGPLKDPIIDPPKRGLDKVKEISEETYANIKDALGKLKPKNGKKFLITTGVITALITAGYFVVGGKLRRPDGTEADETDIEKVDPYKNMYEDRMKAGQQQRQNEAAQKFVEENKSTIKTQREFYNAALQKGDLNFANDVIAIVKRDMPALQVEIK